MKQFLGVFYFAVFLVSCKHSPNYSKSLTIDSLIKEKVIQNVTKYKDTLQLSNDSVFLSNKYMVKLYINDTLSRSTYKSPIDAPFKSHYSWNRDTLNLYGVFNFGIIGFTISIYGDTAKVLGVLNDNIAYKNNLTDSIQSPLLIPTTESHVVLAKMPNKMKPELVFGYVEFKQKNIFSIEDKNRTLKERQNMKAYFISEILK